MIAADTIAAVATPPGMGGVAVVRISGPDARRILMRIFEPAGGWRGGPRPRRMVYGRVMLDGQPVDDALAVYFRGPRSYTGEDAAEIHGHGGWTAPRRTLEAALAAGARMAAPGEFTQRAFHNGKIDLSQAEAVMDMVSASTDSAAQVAYGQLSGRLRSRVEAARSALLDALAGIEVTIDYPEDDLDAPVAQESIRRIEAIARDLKKLLATAQAGRIYREGVRCAIVGRPNVGKSSLLNALLGEDRAIVTDTPGTTRDTLEAEIDVHGLRVVVVDTAGIRASSDPLEQMGVERARRAVSAARLALFLVDGTRPIRDEDRALYREVAVRPHIVLRSKLDAAELSEEAVSEAFPGVPLVSLSAKTGEGLDQLERAILDVCAGGAVLPGEALMSNVRHIDAVRRAHSELDEALATLRSGFPPDLATPGIRAAWHALGEVTGGTVDEDVVRHIFAHFCVGK